MFNRCLFFLFTMTAVSVISLYIDKYYSSLRQINGAWVVTRMVKGSSITNIIFNLLVNSKGQYSLVI